MVHLYYGYGKGKTSAAIGFALRAAGAGMRGLCFQFLKGNNSSERKLLDKLTDVISGRDNEKFIFQMNDEEKSEAAKYYSDIFDNIIGKCKDYDFVILDEITDAVETGFISGEKLFDFINEYKGSTEIIITGHNPAEELIESCDYVTEMKKIKHPYDKGIRARRGIEY